MSQSTIIDRPPRRRHSAVRNYFKELRNAPYRKEYAKREAMIMGARQGYTYAPHRYLKIRTRTPNPYVVNTRNGIYSTPRQVRLMGNSSVHRLQAIARGMQVRRRYKIMRRIYRRTGRKEIDWVKGPV